MKKIRIFFILLCNLFFFTNCEDKSPIINSINPRIGIMGENITISGANFGQERNESYITIAGTSPTGSSYISWQDNEIIIRVPEFAEPGLIYVHREGKKSNPALFANRAFIPQAVQSVELSINPQIISIEPRSAAIGSLVTIQGRNFGPSRGTVNFAWDSETLIPAEHRSSEVVDVFDAEFGYELWSDREIRIRIPDGAVSGNLWVRTTRGSSPPFFFEITGRPGTKVYTDKRSYTISYAVDIQVEEAAIPNTLYLWIPLPVSSASQRNVELLSRNIEPYIENHRGTSLYQLIDFQAGTSRRISLSYVVDVYTVETEIQPQAIRQDRANPIHAIYTLPSILIPSDDSTIIAQSTAIIGREQNPYLRAALIYNWIINEIEIQSNPLGGGVLEALEEKLADSYSSSLLFTALARAAGIPCIPVSGVLADRFPGVSSRHYWVEIWIDGFGWIPVDPALGAGIAPADFIFGDDPAAWYFGNSDNQRIAFSRGPIILAQMDPRGRVSGRTRDFALQNLWEEAVGGLESYSSLWSDVTITGIYAH